jgi:hypothetical protein
LRKECHWVEGILCNRGLENIRQTLVVDKSDATDSRRFNGVRILVRGSDNYLEGFGGSGDDRYLRTWGVTNTDTISVKSSKRTMVALAAVAETNGTTAAAKVSAAIPDRTFKGMSAMTFLRRLWKMLQLTTSIRRLNHRVNARYPAGAVPRPSVASIYENETDSDRQPPRF